MLQRFLPVLGAGLLLGAPMSSLSAQWTPAAGSTVGLSNSLPTEGRGGAAPWLNSATLGLWDGPMSSLQLLEGQIDPLQIRWMLRERAALTQPIVGTRVGLGPATASVLRDVGQRTLPTNGHAMASGVRWIGLQSRGLAFSVQSVAISRMAISDRVGAMALGDADAATGAPTSADSAASSSGIRQSVATSAAAGITNNFGVGGKRTWTAVTAKGSWVHSQSRSSLTVEDATALSPTAGVTPIVGNAGLRWDNLTLRDMFLWGVDAGILVQTDAKSFISLGATNLFQRSMGGSGQKKAFTQTRLDVPGRIDGEWTGTVSREEIDGRDLVGDQLATGTELANSSRFTPTIRVGGSHEVRGGRILTGYTYALSKDESLDRALIERWSLGFATAGHVSIRASTSQRLTGERVWGLGMLSRGCRTSLSAGGAVINPKDGRPRLNVSTGVSIGTGPCRQGR